MPAETGAGDFADRTWSSPDGLRLHARDYPAASGPARLPVVCLHGLTRNARDFEDLAPRLAASGRRVLAAEMRGRGASAWDPNPLNYRTPVYAADVIALLAALGVGRAHFVGTSMGGLITLVLASVRPQLVAGAVLNDIGPQIAPEGAARIRDYVGQPAEVADWEGAAAYAERLNAAVFPHYGAADWRRMARRLFREDAAGRPVLDYDPAIAIPIRAAPGGAPSLWPLWTRLTRGRPVLAVRGEHSDLLARRTFERMRRRAAAVVEIPGVGHAPMLDEPVALGAVLEFLAPHP